MPSDQTECARASPADPSDRTATQKAPDFQRDSSSIEVALRYNAHLYAQVFLWDSNQLERLGFLGCGEVFELAAFRV